MADEKNPELSKLNIAGCPTEWHLKGIIEKVWFDRTTGRVYDCATKQQIGYGKMVNGIMHVYKVNTQHDN